MRLGIHLSSFTPNWADDITEYIPVAANIGYQSVEIPLMFPFDFDWKTTKATLSKYRLGSTCGTGLNDNEDISSTDSKIYKAGIDRLKQCVDICNYLETDCLGGVLYTPWGTCNPREGREANRAAAIAALQEVAEYGKNKSVTLSLEILNRYEGSLINTMDEGLQFLGEVGAENIKLHFDTFHGHIEEINMGDAIRRAGSAIYHVHLCDNNRGAPGTGSIDFLEIVKGLKDIGYNRHLMVENFVIPNSEAGNATSIWRSIGNGPIKNAELAFLNMSSILFGEEN